MTEKQIDKLADIIAEKVMIKLVAKQQEWDKQFYEQFEDGLNLASKLSNKEKLEIKIKELKALRNSYIINENYELLSDVEAEIVKLKKELSNL